MKGLRKTQIPLTIKKAYRADPSSQVACWKGKSRLNAWKNQLVDQRTNSIQEGFRLEGIETPPKSLEERIHAVMEAKGMAATSKYVSPKVRLRSRSVTKTKVSQCLTKGETSSDIKFSSWKKLLRLSLIFSCQKPSS